MDDLYAHTPNSRGEWHSLADHLRGTAEKARRFAEPMGPEARSLAYYAGLAHDVGKCRVGWQDYLREVYQDPQRRGSGGDHKGAGALWARQFSRPLALLIQGHHGGLPNNSDVIERLPEWQSTGSLAQEALAVAGARREPRRAPPPAPLPHPAFVSQPAFGPAER